MNVLMKNNQKGSKDDISEVEDQDQSKEIVFSLITDFNFHYHEVQKLRKK